MEGAAEDADEAADAQDATPQGEEVAEGEKITKYFCALEKRNYVSKQMIRLTLNDGEEIYETKDIIKEVKMFYERLYSDRQLEDCEILDLVEDIPTLTVQKKTSLEGKLL